MRAPSPRILPLLRCPRSGGALALEDGVLVAPGTDYRYAISPSGIPLLADGVLSRDGEAQRDHYDEVAASYLTNLTYPHTREYMAYLDRALLGVAGAGSLGSLGTTAEICCGAGEGLHLFGSRIEIGVGVD